MEDAIKEPKFYILKKGAADPFRGDWYLFVKNYSTAEEAIKEAAALTLSQYLEFKTDWEEFGYEWSVFEKLLEVEKKIWEGYKYIKSSEPKQNEMPDLKYGLV